MSPPDHFSIQYSINPWMNLDNPVDHQQAKSQWTKLRKTYLELGLKVLEIPPTLDFPDLVFTTDHGVWIQDTFYLSNFRYPERQGEQKIITPWYQRYSIKTQTIPSICYMEGGDVVVHNNHIYLGYGYRTSLDTSDYLHNTTQLPITSLELVDEAFYHLDTCFLPLTPDTAFYYPQAFTLSGIKQLKSSFDILIPLTSREAEGFACNSVLLGKNILCQPNPLFEQKLLDLDFTPITLNVSEFNKSGGGIHCLSQILG